MSQQNETFVNGERKEDPSELTSGDFASAATGIQARPLEDTVLSAAASTAGCATEPATLLLQNTAASALNYVKDMVMPSKGQDASNDPEVKVGCAAACTVLNARYQASG